MKTIGAFEAKTHLSELLRQVERGETFEIRRRNRPVARLVGLPAADRRKDVEDMLAAVRALRKGRSVSTKEIHDWVREGRR
jgi:prevent-host-death family protein